MCVCVWVCEREKEKDKKEQNCLDEKINEETEWVERPTEITSRIVKKSAYLCLPQNREVMGSNPLRAVCERNIKESVTIL